MSKKLAIKGHPTRGKEVIELLEMMGGKNYYNLNGLFSDYGYYFIGGPHNGEIRAGEYIFDEDDMCFFTLEEFLEKYPFKVGDKIVYTKFGDNCDDYPFTIESMKWTGTTIEYTFNDCVTCLAKDLKIWNGEPDTVISGIYLNSCDYADEVELNLGDYEIEVRDGKTYAVNKKSKYPTTYEECCKISADVADASLTCFACKLLNDFQKLLLCRCAYWEIAGEQMGLGRPWEPDWTSGKPFYCISVSGNIIGKGKWCTDNKILAFPTEKMRDAFYHNFKDLIESCKELL